MSKHQLMIKVSSFKEAIEEFKAIWKQAAQRTLDNAPIEVLCFEDLLTLLKTLTPRRVELLQH